jgi:hypothetical protein
MSRMRAWAVLGELVGASGAASLAWWFGPGERAVTTPRDVEFALAPEQAALIVVLFAVTAVLVCMGMGLRISVRRVVG